MKQNWWLAGACVVALALTGCAKQSTSKTADYEAQLQSKETALEEMEAKMAELERAKQRAEAEAKSKADAVARAEREAREAREEAAKAKSASTATTTASTSTSGDRTGAAYANFGGSELLPPNAKPGECYTRVHVPPTYKTVTERKLVREAAERLEIVPAKYGWGEERVLVKPESKKIEVIPATYEWKNEQVLVKPASTKLVEVPAQYDWVEEKVLVKEAHTVWKKGRGAIERVDDSTGEIMCLIEVPAEYKTVRKKVMTKAPSTKEVAIPAEYKTVKTKVMTKPPTTREVTIPAEYQTMKVQTVTSPPKEIRKEIPAEYTTVTRTELVTEGKMDWRPILCETNMTNTTVRDIQRALQAKGHNPGPIDGIYGRQTSSAVASFQRKNNLATGGLTYATLKKLGVKI